MPAVDKQCCECTRPNGAPAARKDTKTNCIEPAYMNRLAASVQNGPYPAFDIRMPNAIPRNIYPKKTGMDFVTAYLKCSFVFLTVSNPPGIK